jgi:DNA polymerase III subunit alpha
MGIRVLGPDVNESKKQFSPNKKGEIRFGLGGIKGTGDAAVDDIIEKRKEKPYTDIFDFMIRVNLRTVNKKSLESMAYAGAFDCFEDVHRAIYFDESDGSSFIEKIIRYANKHHENVSAGQNSLFGALGGNAFEVAKPKIPTVELWGDIQKLKFEKEVVGFYISGHPLDEYRMEMSRTVPLDQIFEPHNQQKEFAIGGVVSTVQIRQSKNGNPFAIVKLEDYNGTTELALFGQDYVNFSNFLQVGLFLFIRGKVQMKWGRQDEFEFKPLQMELLSEIRKKLFKEVKISIGLQLVNAELINKINAVTERYSGTFDLKINIFDPEERLDVQMLMRKGRVALSNDLAKELGELVGEKNVVFG